MPDRAKQCLPTIRHETLTPANKALTTVWYFSLALPLQPFRMSAEFVANTEERLGCSAAEHPLGEGERK